MSWYKYSIRLVTAAACGLLLAACNQASGQSGSNGGSSSTAASADETEVQVVSFPAGQPIEQLTIERSRHHEFGGRVVFAVRIAGAQPQDRVSVTASANTPDSPSIAELNDIGWPPDVIAGDGVFTGLLNWDHLLDPAQQLSLEVLWMNEEEVLGAQQVDKFELKLSQLESAEIAVLPSPELTVTDQLIVHVKPKPRNLTGSLAVQIGDLPNSEIMLHDDGQPPDEKVGDGVWSGQLDRSLTYLPPDTELPLTLEHISAGAALKSIAGPKIKVLPPPVYLTSFTREPAGSVEFGAPVILRVTFNKSDPSAEAIVYIGEQHDTTISDLHVVGQEGNQHTGEWYGELLYNNTWLAPGESLPIRVEYAAGGKLQSVLEGEPLTLKPPDVKITGMRFDPEPPYTVGDRVLVYVTTNKPTRGGGIRIMVGDRSFGHVEDSGVHYVGGDDNYADNEAQDGEWVGRLLWYCCPDYLGPGQNVPVRAEYVLYGPQEWDAKSGAGTLHEQVLSSFNGGTITINAPEVKIKNFFYTPESPVKYGSELIFSVELEEPLKEGRITVQHGDGEAIAYLLEPQIVPSELSRVWRGKIIWREETKPGTYSDLTLRYFMNDGSIDQFWDVMEYIDPLVVLPEE